MSVLISEDVFLKKMEEISKRFDAMDSKIGGMDSKMDTISGDVSIVMDDVSGVKKDVSIVMGDVITVKKTINTIQKAILGQTEVILKHNDILIDVSKSLGLDASKLEELIALGNKMRKGDLGFTVTNTIDNLFLEKPSLKTRFGKKGLRGSLVRMINYHYSVMGRPKFNSVEGINDFVLSYEDIYYLNRRKDHIKTQTYRLTNQPTDTDQLFGLIFGNYFDLLTDKAKTILKKKTSPQMVDKYEEIKTSLKLNENNLNDIYHTIYESVSKIRGEANDIVDVANGKHISIEDELSKQKELFNIVKQKKYVV
jgi:hypothetical protein